MTLAEMVRQLAAAGATAEMIAIAVQAVEERDRADEQRRSDRAAARQRQRLSRDNAATVARHGSDNAATVASCPSPEVSPKDITQTPFLAPIPHSEPNGSGGKPPRLASPSDRVWALAPELAARAGRSEKAIRSYLGKALSEFDADVVERACLAAIAEGSGDPIAFITRCLKPAKPKARGSPDPNSWEAFDPEALKAAHRERQNRERLQ